jgi:hypothetical protein
MDEKLQYREEQIERLDLSEIRAGDVLIITTGLEDKAWEYTFTVDEADRWPKGTLKATAPDGSETEPIGFEMHGAGKWTTRRQNPVQKEDWAFSSYFDSVYLTAFLIGRFDGHSDRSFFDKPGQEIVQIRITRSE